MMNTMGGILLIRPPSRSEYLEACGIRKIIWKRSLETASEFENYIELPIFCSSYKELLRCIFKTNNDLYESPSWGMAQYRPKHRPHSGSDNSVITRRKLQSRRIAISRRRVFTIANNYPNSRVSVASSASSTGSPRAVLVPLQFNLRRLPSRILSNNTQPEEMQHAPQMGTKRKRQVSGTENTNGRGPRTSAHRVKRRKASRDSSGESSSEMDVDVNKYWQVSDDSDGEDALDSSANYLIHEAPPKQLLRLRKDELARLYSLAGLSEDPALLTKPEIVDCLIATREDLVSLPPSSPPQPTDSNSSDYSSDGGGNVAGGEETDVGHRLRNSLKRRVTLHEVNHTPTKPHPERCFSLGEIERSERYFKRRPQLPNAQPLTRRRGLSNAGSDRSSPTTSVASTMLPSPPATRLRSRQVSGESSTVVSSSSSKKAKTKQVEFSDNVQIGTANHDSGQESDLTDLTEVEASIVPTTPSPRRLRSKPSKGRVSQDEQETRPSSPLDLGRRVTPKRKAKPKAGSLKEDDTEEEEDQLDESDADDEWEEAPESDQSLVTPKATKVQRTPVRRRLRSRKSHLLTPPSDGDDEGTDDESVDIEQSIDGDSSEEEDEGTAREEESEDEEAPVSKPRTLRNGKVVGDEIESSDSLPELTDTDVDEGGNLPDEDAASVDLDAEGDSETSEDVEEIYEDGVEDGEADESMDDDSDLADATKKSLVRLRRDDLVRLCEARGIEASGTKPQLADALLRWRDQNRSAPSSTGTTRPPDTARPRHRRNTRSKSNSKTPPVLLRSERVHIDEPVTPPLSTRTREHEPEVELDLEELGLEDREIPPEKLTKLEKIGSGGFKDVFIGKFKGRKVAIAEFRSQLGPSDIKELKLLGDFDHPNIVRFLGLSIPENTKETPVMIVSELCANGDLFDYIRNVPPPTLYRTLCIMLDIARGLAYLHTRKPSVIHRDCKSSNILITSKGVAKITDFGLAKVKQSTRSMVRSLVGTVNWQAPELWHPHPKYNHKVDVFSCAMVFWEMLQWHNPNKKFPWEGLNEHAIYDLVGAKRQRPSVHGLSGRWCPEIVDLIEPHNLIMNYNCNLRCCQRSAQFLNAQLCHSVAHHDVGSEICKSLLKVLYSAAGSKRVSGHLLSYASFTITVISSSFICKLKKTAISRSTCLSEARIPVQTLSGYLFA
ncbi:hypothetical protein K474DRAFT_1701070, partial [Panus rudis PR-1116 ss-1]